MRRHWLQSTRLGKVTDNLPPQTAAFCKDHGTELWMALNPLLQLNKGWLIIMDAAFDKMRRDIDNERIMNLDDRRLAPADEAFSLYDFGETVKDSGGWEYTQGEGVWKRSVFFENGDNPSVKKMFVIKFDKDTTDVNEAFVED